MAYRLHRFDEVLLPIYTPAPDMSTGQVESTLLDSVGGTYDYYSTRQRLPRRQVHSFSGVYVGELGLWVDEGGNQIVDHEHVANDNPIFLVDEGANFLVDEGGNFLVVYDPGNTLYFGSAYTDLRSQIDALTAKLGVRGQLWRQRLDPPAGSTDYVLQWKYARLLQVQHPRVQEDQHQAKISCTFETLQPAWRAATPITTQGTLVANGSVGLLIDNGGNVTVSDAIITITASGTINRLTIVRATAGARMHYTGTLVSGQALVIDCGAQTVRLNGANTYSNFALATDHTAADWCPLDPGSNSVVVWSNGPGSVTVQHDDQFL